MSELSYDEPQLVRELERLQPRLRATFAAACAQRLLPAYARFAERTGRGAPAELAALLDRLWRDLEGDPMSADQVQQNLDRCDSLIPGEGEGDTEQPRGGGASTIEDILAAARARAAEAVTAMEAQAEDAAEAVAYAYRCRLNGAAQEAAWASGCAYEALDNWVSNTKGIDTDQPAADEQVLSDPLIQAELGRQHRDLEELIGIRDEAAIADSVVRLRDRAKAEASAVFG